MAILWQIIAICLTSSARGDQKEVNYCGRLDVRPDHVKHYLTTPGYPAKAAEGGRCQWLIATNGDFNVMFSDMNIQKLCSGGNGVVFVDILAKERIAHQSLCNAKPGQVFVSQRNEVEVIITFPPGASIKMAYQKIPPKLAQKLNGKGPSISPAGGRTSFGRPKSPFRVPQIAQNPHGARASAIPSSKQGSTVQSYGSYGGAYKNYGNYNVRYNQLSHRQGVQAAEYAGNPGNQIQNYENDDFLVYADYNQEKLEENKSPKKNSQSVMIFSIVGMLCFIVAIVGFMIIIKNRQDKNDDKIEKNDSEKLPEKK